jgi:hypothetical protein
MIALGESAGAVMSQFRPAVERYARARVAANPAAHGLAGSAEYDEEVRGRAVFTAEAGLSFLHTHAQGLGLVVLLTGTVAATVVRPRALRGVIHALLAVGGLFPLGYLAYGVAVLELGRDAGIEWAETWFLVPLGSAAIAGLAILGAVLARAAVRRDAREP